MQRSNLSRCLSKDEVRGFLDSDDNEEEEVSDSDWISTDNDKEDREEISSCNSFLKKKGMANCIPLLPQTTLFQNEKGANNAFPK